MNKLLVIASCLAIAGCASMNTAVVPDDPEFAPVYPEEVPVEAKITGSLFAQDQANNLYSDKKAHRVGDIACSTKEPPISSIHWESCTRPVCIPAISSVSLLNIECAVK